MGDSSGLIEIVVLAMLAGFIALRLVSVLGRRTGHEEPAGEVVRRSPAEQTPPPRSGSFDLPPAAPLDLPADMSPALRESLKDDAGVDPSVLSDIARGDVGGLAMRLTSNRLQSAAEVPEAVRNAGAKYLFSNDPAVKREALSLLQREAGILNNRRLVAPPSLYTPAASGLLGAQFGGRAQ